MSHYYSLLREATACGLTVIEKRLKSKAKGIIKGTKIGLQHELLKVEKICVLAEEVGHHHTAVGDFTDQSKLENRKKERLGRVWSYEYLIPLSLIVAAGQAGIQGRHAVAEYLEVTEEFLLHSIEHYQRKYGLYTSFNNYLIYFDPLSITKM
ncbi:MAG TPA: ImmA/IrrE family metallo-endopeptidase [Candidatus Paenibacillus intestinavium]|nr:ImmA/IrrE family metallo-endopeptidase [Candidatus Paenibacillus intestinavium]